MGVAARALAAVIVAYAASASIAAPKSELWEMWLPHDDGSDVAVDHSFWDGFLKRHITPVDGVNLLGYAGVPSDDRAALKKYIADIAALPVLTLSRDEQLAYWINMYNAVTVDLILDNLPVDSIRDISGGFLPTGPWDDEAVTVEGVALTLNDIEHRILRPIWRDPRIHYAVNCASIGCPNLATDAFDAANAQRLLEEGAVAYVNHPRGARVTGGSLYVSSIYEWFKVDFGGTDATVIEHLTQYADEDLAASLAGITSISGDDYDWSLNGAS